MTTQRTKRKPTVKAPTVHNNGNTPQGNGTDGDGNDIIKSLFDQNQSKETERLAEFRAAVQAVFNDEALQMKSVLDKRQLIALVRGAIFAEHYKSKTMGNLVTTVLKLSVSVARKDTGSGRFDLREVVKSLLRGHNDNVNDSDVRRHLMGE